MRFQGPALGALLLALACATPSAHAAMDPDMLSGLVLGAGQAHSRDDETGFGTALFADANYIAPFLNGGVSYKDFDDNVANAYVGVGISGLLQLQVGSGNQGNVKRVRTDINISRMIDFFGDRPRNRYNQSFGTRITFTFAAEEYNDDRRFDNFQAGLGLIF
ncbi:MAG: hypothetical protein V4729_02965 [Pseudomonadota bacterium]